MNFTFAEFPPALRMLAWAIWLPAVVWALRCADWKKLLKEEKTHFWLGATVGLMVLWRIKAGIQPGLDLHLLGANFLMLAFGPELAFLSLNLVLLGLLLNSGGQGWEMFAMNALHIAGVGVWVSHRIWLLASRWLPPQVFIFIFINGFFAAGLTLLAVGVSGSLLLALSGAYPMSYLLENYLPYCLMLAFSESWLSGMVVTLLVVYCPQWLACFDAQRYFRYSDRVR